MSDRQRNEEKICCYCTNLWIIIPVFIIAMLTLLGLAVNHKIDQGNIGIVQNSITTDFGKRYDQGVWTLNIGDTLIIVPLTLQDADINTIICLTSDKIRITLSVSFQYQYTIPNIISIVLMMFNNTDTHERMIQTIILSTIYKQCGQYTAEDYYTNRGTIYNNMYTSMTREINNSTVYNIPFGASIEYFQLINIAFPTDFSTAITTKQLVIQNQTTAMNNRASQLINANTTLLQNQRTAEIMLINANNIATININQAQTTRNAILYMWSQRLATYTSVMNSLQLNQSQFVQYLNAEVLKNANSPVISV